MSFATRVRQFRTALLPHQAVLLSRPADIRYLTNFICLNPDEREAFCLVTKKSLTLLYPSFSPVTKLKHVTYYTGHWPSDVEKVARDLVEKEKITSLLVDTSSLFVNEYQQLQTIDNLKLDSWDKEMLGRIRQVKDTTEIKALAQANHQTALVMKQLFARLRVGMTEQEIANECELLFKQLGVYHLAFPPVIAFGEHTALPHHQPTNTTLTQETAVLFDIGGKVDGYCGDMTRTWWFGNQPAEEFLKIEKIVKKAYDAGISQVRAGCDAATVDNQVRTLIEKAGYGDKFIHTTGHALGLEIHEPPSLYFKKSYQLPKNSVITIEPGIYLEGTFGYRYENTILIEANTAKELTK